eukprot:SAG22_NODE_96_length_20771_cov_33.186018_4_plen_405_part_00
MIELTSVDGVRLDGLGGQYAPCFNKDHDHETIFENMGTAANVQMAAMTRKAMDSVDSASPGKEASILSSEGYYDVFHPHTQMALVMWYPGRDIDAMRVALPEYRAAAYSPDAGDIETGLNGWLASGSMRALRMVWPYGSACGAPPLSGFPGPPCNYPAPGLGKNDAGGRTTRWTELRPTWVGALLPGKLSLKDPVAPQDPEFVSRLYLAETHALLLTARWNGSVPAGPTTIVLPAADGGDAEAGEALRGVEHAVEVDAYTLAVSTPAVNMVGGAAASLQVAAGGFSAVLLPKPSCPALLMLTPAVVPVIDATGANATTIALGLHAPWQAAASTSTAAALAAAVTVKVTAPGLILSASTLTLPGSLTIRAANQSSLCCRHTNVFLMLTIEGDGVLPTRRWVEAVF